MAIANIGATYLLLDRQLSKKDQLKAVHQLHTVTDIALVAQEAVGLGQVEH